MVHQLLLTISHCCSIPVVKAAGECLREVLASKSGSTLLTQLEEKQEEEVDVERLWWCRYLHPFKPHKKKKVNRLLVCKQNTPT